MEERIKRRMEKIQHGSGENMEPDMRTPKNIHKTQQKNNNNIHGKNNRQNSNK